MSLQKNVSEAISGHNALAVALSQIAQGRPDNGRPIAAEAARQLARETLTSIGLDWVHVLKVHAEMKPAFEKLRGTPAGADTGRPVGAGPQSPVHGEAASERKEG
jgi:hypothetical protein